MTARLFWFELFTLIICGGLRFLLGSASRVLR